MLMHTTGPRVGLIGLALLVMLGISGCGEPGAPTGSVKGKVVFEGQPVTEGIVNFFNKAKGTGAQANLDSGGNFALATSIPTGDYVVYITPPRPPDPVPGQSAPAPKDYSNIPAKYRNENNTLLNAKVERGGNTFSFEMKR